MKTRVNHDWQDAWILENLFEFSSYAEAAEAYRKTFCIDISVPALKNHCRYKLGIQKPRSDNYRHITEEQADWIRCIYPRLGVKKTRELWNERYKDSLSCTCIKQIARRICDVVVNPDVATANKLKAVHGKGSKRATRGVGDTRMECGRLVMKADDGEWKSAGRCVWEKEHGAIPTGYALVALDGNTANIRLENLDIVPWNYLGKLQRNGFFSSNPNVTKTGIIWCDLQTVLSDNSQLSQTL